VSQPQGCLIEFLWKATVMSLFFAVEAACIVVATLARAARMLF
jgi:hypothetical protein